MNILYDDAKGIFCAPCAVCGEPVLADGEGWALMNEARADANGRFPVEIVHHGSRRRCLERHEAKFGEQPDHHLEFIIAQIATDLGLSGPPRPRRLEARR